MGFALTIDLERPFGEVLAATRGALAASGFGIVSEIDLQKTLRDKIGVDVGEHVILGACNPRYAQRGLEIEPSLGVLLPCNVVVRHSAGLTVVEAIDPETMVMVTENPAMADLADEVRQALKQALDQVSAS
ncbi:DUF302 domain-containing protein [Raineyella fluvialis]|uniref:DUF302 domain-containing protein n=1 Tax=Raineyella fluvialis TaxID=2662261 RepID=A0A5Q2FDA4_9ACTN|nr:DUF302 domain-containing protein [Raineyella fluvialis]QGF23063.1 DUF302 domain-containing protein [Raineyella fluvialis]